MRLRPLLLSLVAAAASPLLLAQRTESYQPNPDTSLGTMVTKDDLSHAEGDRLNSEVTQNIYTALGYSTFLQFPKSSEFGVVTVGAKNYLSIEVKADQKAIILTPKVLSGQTNMTVVLNKQPYNFLINILPQGRIHFKRTFTFPYMTDEGGKAVSFGPPVRPQDINANKYIALIENYGLPSAKAADYRWMEHQELKQALTWNNTLVYLTDAFGFPRDNLVVLKVLHRNYSSKASYLAASQIMIYVANTPFPVTVGLQARPLLYPGEMDTVYLFVQGYNLRAQNDFQIELPPNSAKLNTYLANGTHP